MSSLLFLVLIVIYFGILMLISYLTTRKVDSQSFYTGNRKSPWYIVATAMIGTSISGVTFISVPGWVLTSNFAYIQMVLGFLLGYVIVANVLLPLYYKLNLVSIYSYLNTRFGRKSYKTGASFFLLSRTLGSAFRLYIVAIVLQKALFDQWNIPFYVTVAVTILLIFLYTRKGGIKTVIWTDTVQSIILFSAAILCVVFICKDLDFSFTDMFAKIKDSEYSRTWFFDDWNDKRFFWKQFLAGVFTVVTMTGLDQDMMQKNLSCRNLKDAKKNMYSYGFLFLPVNLLFLSIGVLLVYFWQSHGLTLPTNGDELFPVVATTINPETGQLYLGTLVGVLFFLGVIAAAYSSADSAITALTTSFTVDILEVKDDDPKLIKKRTAVHIGISLIMGLVIVLFKVINNESIINSIYTVAGYTYGPLLGLYAFGLFTRFKVKDRLVPYIAIASPVLSFLFSMYSKEIFNGYEVGFEILIINGLITFIGLLAIKKKDEKLTKI